MYKIAKDSVTRAVKWYGKIMDKIATLEKSFNLLLVYVHRKVPAT